MDVRGSTGTSMKGAFTRSAKAVREKIERLDEGARRSSTPTPRSSPPVRTGSRWTPTTRTCPSPATFRPDPEKTADENKTARGLHQGAVNDYWDRYAKREAEARRIADALDTKYADSVAVMKADPRRARHPSTNARSGTPAPCHQARQAGHPAHPSGFGGPAGEWDPPKPWDPPAKDPTDPPGPEDPTDPPGPSDPPGPLDPHDPFDPHLPSIPGHPGGIDPVTAGGVGLGGGLGLAGLSNAIRGGLAVPGQAVRPSSPIRPIGSTSRAAVSGALGRGAGAMGTGSPTTGRGAGGRGVGAGGARAASGTRPGGPRQAGAGAGQAGRNQGGRGAGSPRSSGRGAGAGCRRTPWRLQGRGREEVGPRPVRRRSGLDRRRRGCLRSARLAR